MNLMAPTVSMIAQSVGYGERRATGQASGRFAGGGGGVRNAALLGVASATSREAAINAADVLRAVVEGTRTAPPPPRNPVANETAVSPRDFVRLELIRTLLAGQTTYVPEAEWAQPAFSGAPATGSLNMLA